MVERTIVSRRRDEEIEELRRAMRRLFKMSLVAWPSFVVLDAYVVWLGGRPELAWLMVGLRATGVLVLLLAHTFMRRANVSARSIVAVDIATFTAIAVLVTLLSAPFGGITSRGIQGILLLSIARATFIPARGARSLLMSLPTALAFPATFALLALGMPEVRAQWSSAADVAVFVHNYLFVIASVLLGAFGSDVLWRARRQVWEARKLGHYRLKARIGGGGMGDVWLARQDGLERHVALKVLSEQASRDADAVRRFVREARAASSLRHPNTIRVYDFGASDDGIFYLAMELLNGLDLETIVATSGPIAPSRAIRFARQVCGSLAEAHEAGIIHRDIKPANLFVTQVGDEFDFLKVLDFGIARITRGDAWNTAADAEEMCGTPSYISPEMVRSGALDARSDLYSLGAVLYFMVTGTTIFPDEAFGEIVAAHVGRAPDPPRMRNPLVPEDLERVILKCLEKQPRNRYATAHDLDRALAACEDAPKWQNDLARAYWTSLRPSVRLRLDSLSG